MQPGVWIIFCTIKVNYNANDISAKLPIWKVALCHNRKYIIQACTSRRSYCAYVSVSSSIIASMFYYWTWHRNTICAVCMPQSLIMIDNIYCHNFYKSFISTNNISHNTVCKDIFKTTDMIMSVIEVFVIYLCKRICVLPL